MLADYMSQAMITTVIMCLGWLAMPFALFFFVVLPINIITRIFFPNCSYQRILKGYR